MDLRNQDTPVMTFKGQKDKQINSCTFNVRREKKVVYTGSTSEHVPLKENPFEDRTEKQKIKYDKLKKPETPNNRNDLNKLNKVPIVGNLNLNTDLDSRNSNN